MTWFNHRGTAAGLIAAAAVTGAIVLGSGGLTRFDPATFAYAVGSVLAAFAVASRFALWAQRPPTKLYFTRGVELLLRRRHRHGRHTRGAVPKDFQMHPREDSPPIFHGPGTLAHALASNFVAQNFIRRRSRYRWIMHLCLSGGCTLAFAITFPLVFGWVHFESFPTDAEMYRLRVFGRTVDSFHIHSVKAFAAFNLLNFSAVLVMIGLIMAAVRRATDAGERATQKFFEDILPLLLIFAVTATGLMLTVSYKFLAGRGHGLAAVVHCITVIALLFYIPFGKLFHMVQRLCALCVALYQEAGTLGARAHCLGCGHDYASRMHVDDLKLVLDELGFNYRFATPDGDVHYQDICPACRRRMLALNQGTTLGR